MSSVAGASGLTGMEIQISTRLVTNKQEKMIDYNFQVNVEPPKFTDWLFKKSRTKNIVKQIKVTTKDVLLNPPINIPNQQYIRFAVFEPIDPIK